MKPLGRVREAYLIYVILIKALKEMKDHGDD